MAISGDLIGDLMEIAWNPAEPRERHSNRGHSSHLTWVGGSDRLRRQPTRLTTPRSVAVPFTGDRAAEKPMTLGQLNMLKWLGDAVGHPYATLGAELVVSGDVRVADVVETIAVLLARHEGL